MKQNRGVHVCDALRAVTAIIKSNAAVVKDIPENKLSDWLQVLLDLLKCSWPQSENSLKYEICVPNQILMYVTCCLDTFLSAAPLDNSDKQLNDIMAAILDIIYKTLPIDFGEEYYCQLITSALNICGSISQMSPNLCAQYTGEILGASKSFILFGIPDVPKTRPLKVNVSQQAISEPQISGPNTMKGGKMAKTRKVKRNGKGNQKPNIHTAEVTEVTDVNKALLLPQLFALDFGSTIPSFYKTSDSDFSESESSRANKHLQKQTKLRFAALALIGILGKVIFVINKL